jgi:hypothetical protein
LIKVRIHGTLLGPEGTEVASDGLISWIEPIIYE